LLALSRLILRSVSLRLPRRIIWPWSGAELRGHWCPIVAIRESRLLYRQFHSYSAHYG
jgi:hypothetical protein